MTSRWWVLALSVVLFELSHVPAWAVFGLDWLQVGFVALWGIAFGLLRLFLRGLVLPIAGHTLINFL